MENYIELIKQIRGLINPDRRGGVSALELGKAVMVLNTLESKLTKRAADECQGCGSKYAPSAQYCHVCGTRR